MLKIYRRCNTVREVLKILNNEVNYQYILGFGKNIPSEASLSRRVKEFEKKIDIQALHERLTSSFYTNRLVCNLSIDSTPIDAYEKPVKAEKKKKQRKRRKIKGSVEEKEYQEKLKSETELENLVTFGNINKYLQTLENRCSVTGKRNSKRHSLNIF